LMKWIRQNRFDNQLFFCFEVFWRRLIQNCYFLLFSLSSLITTQPKKKSCLCLIPETHLSRWALFWRPRFVLNRTTRNHQNARVCVCIYIGSFHFSFSLSSFQQLEKNLHIILPT
jgi:hypothetical protein